MRHRTLWAETLDGWRLQIKRYHDPATFDPSKKPLIFLPGYGMNSFVLAYHPEDVSMVEYLVGRGYEVWTANMRGQGASQRGKASRRFGFKELALIDVPTVRRFVGLETASTRDEADLIGCSLGASIAYAYLAHNVLDHGISSLVGIGGPLTWREAHPALRLAARHPGLIGSVPFIGTRALARAALPVVRRVPPLLSMYMNASNIDLSRADELVKTVDDPVPWINRQLAHWLQHGDLIVQGVNVREALADVRGVSLLCVLANADGIVPPDAALSVLDAFGDRDTATIIAGDDTDWFAHADLFIARQAPEQVFAPMADWLDARQ